MAAAGSYTVTIGGQVAGDFYRLRAPMDWAMIALLLHALARQGRSTAQMEDVQ